MRRKKKNFYRFKPTIYQELNLKLRRYNENFFLGTSK